MVSQIKELLEKIPFSVILALYLGSLGWDYYGFLNDPDSQLANANTRLATAREDIGKLRKRVREVQEFSRTLEIKKMEMRKLAQELEDSKTTLSDSLDTPSFMKAVVTEAQRSGLSVMGLKPLEGAKKEYYGQQEFQLQFRGVFAQLVGFLERVSSMQRIVRVDDFRMKPISPSSARYVILEGEMKMKSFYYQGSKADELAKATASAGPAKPGTPPAGAPGAAPASAPAKETP